MMAKKAKLICCKPNEPQLESMRENFPNSTTLGRSFKTWLLNNHAKSSQPMCSWKGTCINTFHYQSTSPFDEGQSSSHLRQSCSKEEPNGEKEWFLNCLNWDASMVCVTIRLWTFNFLSKMEEHPNHDSWLGCYNVINSNLVSKLSNMVEANTLWIWEDAHG